MKLSAENRVWGENVEIPPSGAVKGRRPFYPSADLIFAVVADVVHAHEDRQKFPVRLEVQALERRRRQREWGDVRAPAGSSWVARHCTS